MPLERRRYILHARAGTRNSSRCAFPYDHIFASLTTFLDALRIGSGLLPRGPAGQHPITLVSAVPSPPDGLIHPPTTYSRSASAWNQIACIRILILDYDCPPGIRNAQGFTPLEYAYSTTLAREFGDLIRELSEGRRAMGRLRGGPSPALGYRQSYGTLATSDDGASSYAGAAGRLGTGPYLHAGGTSPEPRSPGSTFSFDAAASAAMHGLGLGRIGSSSGTGTQSPMHRRVSQRTVNGYTSGEMASPGTTSGSVIPWPGGTSSPMARRDSGAGSDTAGQSQSLEAPGPSAGRSTGGADVPPTALHRISSGNRSPSALSPSHTGSPSKWPRTPSRGHSQSEIMARTESTPSSARESPSTTRDTLGIPKLMVRRESSPSVIEHGNASRKGGPPMLGPPV